MIFLSTEQSVLFFYASNEPNFLVVAEVSICAWLTYAKKEYIKRMRNN